VDCTLRLTWPLRTSLRRTSRRRMSRHHTSRLGTSRRRRTSRHRMSRRRTSPLIIRTALYRRTPLIRMWPKRSHRRTPTIREDAAHLTRATTLPLTKCTLQNANEPVMFLNTVSLPAIFL